jgi:CheY-like chemotaxis protein
MPVGESSSTRWKRALILCIDDDVDGRHACVRLLEAVGYEMLEAGDGVEGLSLATTRAPQLILLDLQLPKMDGWEVARRLKADPRTAHVPILALSASVFPLHHQRASEVGCAGFLEKPADARTVRDAVDRLLSLQANADRKAR